VFLILLGLLSKVLINRVFWPWNNSIAYLQTFDPMSILESIFFRSFEVIKYPGTITSYMCLFNNWILSRSGPVMKSKTTLKL
jgi:hypothetical protein